MRLHTTQQGERISFRDISGRKLDSGKVFVSWGHEKPRLFTTWTNSVSASTNAGLYNFCVWKLHKADSTLVTSSLHPINRLAISVFSLVTQLKFTTS